LFLQCFAFLINLIREIVKDLEDIEGDIKAGVITCPVKLVFAKIKICYSVDIVNPYTFYLISLHYSTLQIEYFIIVMVIVNPILVYCLKILLKIIQ